MEIGSPAYIEKLLKRYSFPCDISFVVAKEADGTTSLLSSSTQPTGEVHLVGAKGCAVIGTRNIKSFDEFISVTKEFREIWGVDRPADFKVRGQLP